jgi:hypothetical protein
MTWKGQDRRSSIERRWYPSCGTTDPSGMVFDARMTDCRSFRVKAGIPSTAYIPIYIYTIDIDNLPIYTALAPLDP